MVEQGFDHGQTPLSLFSDHGNYLEGRLICDRVSSKIAYIPNHVDIRTYARG